MKNARVKREKIYLLVLMIIGLMMGPCFPGLVSGSLDSGESSLRNHQLGPAETLVRAQETTKAQESTQAEDKGPADQGSNLKSYPAIIVQDPLSYQFHPFFNQSATERWLTRILYLPLQASAQESKGLKQLALAKSCDVQDYGRTIQIVLQPDLTWSDGEALTSQDVAFTFSALAHPMAPFRFRALVSNMVGYPALYQSYYQKHDIDLATGNSLHHLLSLDPLFTGDLLVTDLNPLNLQDFTIPSPLSSSPETSIPASLPRTNKDDKLHTDVRTSEAASTAETTAPKTRKVLQRFQSLAERGKGPAYVAPLKGIETPDDRTIRLHFSRGNIPALDHLLSFPILPKHIWQRIPVEYWHLQKDLLQNPVVSGLFRVQEINQEEQSLLLVPNKETLWRIPHLQETREPSNPTEVFSSPFTLTKGLAIADYQPILCQYLPSHAAYLQVLASLQIIHEEEFPTREDFVNWVEEVQEEAMNKDMDEEGQADSKVEEDADEDPTSKSPGLLDSEMKDLDRHVALTGKIKLEKMDFALTRNQLTDPHFVRVGAPLIGVELGSSLTPEELQTLHLIQGAMLNFSPTSEDDPIGMESTIRPDRLGDKGLSSQPSISRSPSSIPSSETSKTMATSADTPSSTATPTSTTDISSPASSNASIARDSDGSTTRPRSDAGPRTSSDLRPSSSDPRSSTGETTGGLTPRSSVENAQGKALEAGPVEISLPEGPSMEKKVKPGEAMPFLWPHKAGHLEVLGFNCSPISPCADIGFRRAISLNIDREDLITRLLKGMGAWSDSAVPTNSWIYPYESPISALPFQPERGKLLLQNLGYQVKKKEGNPPVVTYSAQVLRRIKEYQEKLASKQVPLPKIPTTAKELTDNDQVQIKLIFPSNNNLYRNLAEQIQKSLQNQGIIVQIKGLSTQELLDAALRNADFDLILFELDAPTEPLFHQLLASSNITAQGSFTYNFLAYANPNVDLLLMDLAVAINPDERQRIYQKICQYVSDELPLFPLFQPEYALYQPSYTPASLTSLVDQVFYYTAHGQEKKGKDKPVR